MGEAWSNVKVMDRVWKSKTTGEGNISKDIQSQYEDILVYASESWLTTQWMLDTLQSYQQMKFRTDHWT